MQFVKSWPKAARRALTVMTDAACIRVLPEDQKATAQAIPRLWRPYPEQRETDATAKHSKLRI